MLTRYAYRHALGGFFELPVEAARRILPSYLEPVELRHGLAVLNVTAFEFTESEVGSYGELVMAVVVAPIVKPGEPLPHTALFPYRVATTTKAARDHAIERWHLPHWMENIDLGFHRMGDHLTVVAEIDSTPVLELTLTQHTWRPVSRFYQAFMKDEGGAYLAKVRMIGDMSEHEEETGKLIIRDHTFNRELPIAEIYDKPFREVWIRDGIQTFEPLLRTRISAFMQAPCQRTIVFP